MAKFRQNHQKVKGRHSFAARGFILFVVIGALIVFGLFQLSDYENSTSYDINYEPSTKTSSSTYDQQSDLEFLPKSSNKAVIHHKYYSLAYNEKREQSDWVAYRLTKASLEVKNVKRSNRFKYDKKVKTKSAVHKDYSHSGYTRGHMAPAGDMAFNEEAMRECFYMSNMSPQVRPFNNGIWKELEENVRDWAFSNNELYVVTGPIFYDEKYEQIGQNKVAVPDAFYKILVDNNGRDKKSIAYIIPHAKTDKPLRDFAVSIDEVERQTNIDFFPNLFNTDEIEEKMEGRFNLKSWKVSEKRYKQRVDHWNDQ